MLKWTPQPQQHCPEGSHRALESVPGSGTSQAKVSATLLKKVGHHWLCRPSDTGKLGSCHSHTTKPPPEGWLDKHELQYSSLHKSRAFLDLFLMHMLMSWMDGEKEDRKSGRVHFFILKRNNKMGAQWILQDNTALVSPTPPACEHPYVQLCWALCACHIIHINLQKMGRMKPHKIFFSESTTKAGGDGRTWYFGQGLLWEGSVWWRRKLEQGLQTALSLHLNVRMQLPSDTVKRQKAEDLSQDIQPSGLVGILRFLFPSGLEFTQVLVSYVLHSCVIVSLPEAEQTWSQGYQNTSTS